MTDHLSYCKIFEVNFATSSYVGEVRMPVITADDLPRILSPLKRFLNKNFICLARILISYFCRSQ